MMVAPTAPTSKKLVSREPNSTTMSKWQSFLNRRPLQIPPNPRIYILETPKGNPYILEAMMAAFQTTKLSYFSARRAHDSSSAGAKVKV